MKVIVNNGSTFIELNKDEAHSLEKLLSAGSFNDLTKKACLCDLEAIHMTRLFRCLHNKGGTL